MYFLNPEYGVILLYFIYPYMSEVNISFIFKLYREPSELHLLNTNISWYRPFLMTHIVFKFMDRLKVLSYFLSLPLSHRNFVMIFFWFLFNRIKLENDKLCGTKIIICNMAWNVSLERNIHVLTKKHLVKKTSDSWFWEALIKRVDGGLSWSWAEKERKKKKKERKSDSK